MTVEYLTESEMANELGVKVSTLRKNRSLGVSHPPYVKLSAAKVVYPKSEYKLWFEKRINRSLDGNLYKTC